MAAPSPVPTINIIPITVTTPTVATTTAPATATVTNSPATAIATVTTSIFASAAAVPAVTVAASTTPTTTASHAPKNLRGLNKPKCIKCGNVARSRCPYQACKSCCAKAQNPCHIHVLKTNATLPDKTATSSSSLFDQQGTDASATGSSLRASALRQLSQFNGSQGPRARRPMTRKDAAAINQWRFSKLKEYQDRNIETENEAFDRYMQNVSLLEEAFSVDSSVEGNTTDALVVLEPASTNREGNNRVISGLKSRFRSMIGRSDSSRERIQEIVDRGLRKLRKWEFNNEDATTEDDDLDGQRELKRLKKTKDLCADNFSALNDLIDKLKKARSGDDLQSAMQLQAKLFSQHKNACLAKNNVFKTSKETIVGGDSTPEQDLKHSYYSKVEISQEIVHAIDMHFSSLDQIEDL